MTFLDVIILGIIQGLTEFLPVSSSGHLELVKAIQGNAINSEQSMEITVMLHFATALSTIVVFRKDILEILKGLIQFKNNDAFQFSIKIVLSMIPAALVGVFLDDIIESFFSGAVLLVGLMLILTAGLLFLADKAKDTKKDVSISNSIVIGIAQAIAILPGISRSGATIATSVLLGVDRSKSARFSFLMVIPLIFGKIAKDLLSSDKTEVITQTEPISTSIYFVGFLAAFLTGIVACKWMIALVKKAQLKYFSYYCLAIGIFAIIWTTLI